MKLSAVVLTGVFLGATAATAQEINDAQIAAIVVTANQVDIDAGKLAASRGSNPEVKKFGSLMVTDHTGVNKSAVDLATKLKVTPEENDTSRSLKAGGEKNLANLKKLSGAAFDKAYVDHEVAYHTQVLEALDKTLIPNAKNAELKALLVKVRPAFVAHLEHARKLQSSLAAPMAKPASHVVTIDASSYRPATLSVAPGDTVTWVNKDVMPHTATSKKTGQFDSGSIAAGSSWKHTFKTSGELAYFCSFHPTMNGSLQIK